MKKFETSKLKIFPRKNKLTNTNKDKLVNELYIGQLTQQTGFAEVQQQRRNCGLFCYFVSDLVSAFYTFLMLLMCQ